MWVIWRPISSIWPANITRGFPFGFKTATELPCTSARTSSAKPPTSSRQTRPGACSKPDGPAVSSSFFRNPTVLIVPRCLYGVVMMLLFAKARSVEQDAQNRKHDETDDRGQREPAQLVIQGRGLGEPVGRFPARAAPTRDRGDSDAADGPACDQAAREQHARPRFDLCQRAVVRADLPLDEPADDPSREHPRRRGDRQGRR